MQLKLEAVLACTEKHQPVFNKIVYEIVFSGLKKLLSVLKPGLRKKSLPYSGLAALDFIYWECIRGRIQCSGFFSTDSIEVFYISLAQNCREFSNVPSTINQFSINSIYRTASDWPELDVISGLSDTNSISYVFNQLQSVVPTSVSKDKVFHLYDFLMKKVEQGYQSRVESWTDHLTLLPFVFCCMIRAAFCEQDVYTRNNMLYVIKQDIDLVKMLLQPSPPSTPSSTFSSYAPTLSSSPHSPERRSSADASSLLSVHPSLFAGIERGSSPVSSGESRFSSRSASIHLHRRVSMMQPNTGAESTTTDLVRSFSVRSSATRTLGSGRRQPVPPSQRPANSSLKPPPVFPQSQTAELSIEECAACFLEMVENQADSGDL